MVKRLSKRDGSTMVIVIFIIAVLSILIAALLESSVQNLRMCRANGHIDYSYYAGESALQKCFDALKQKCDMESLAFDYNVSYKGDMGAFARDLFDVILKPYVESLNESGAFSNLDVSGDPGNKADVRIDLHFMGYRYDPVRHPGKVFVKIGAEANSTYEVESYSYGGKKVFAQKEFEIKIPEVFKLKGPLYTIGDFMANNGSSVKVTGDVYVYGTSPEIMSQPTQYYYGGVYAKNGSQMHIYGNAYTRSFIRTGEYSNLPDNSLIYIYKDAIAQGIQIFGRGDRIGIYRNAYTFDDLEVNGEDSVIAVNGSFFGLSRGSDTFYHDGSSSIVNSAAVHHSNSTESKKSRIVVNGAVMINGSTFRINPDTGETLYAIEDASIAWYDGGPLYKLYSEGLGYNNYKQWLINEGYATVSKGFANLFQVWKVMKWDNSMRFEEAKANMDDWFSKINAARDSESNNSQYFDFEQIPEKIQGFCHYEMAANDRLYLMDKGSAGDSQVIKASLLNGNYVLDNVTPPEGGWDNFWNAYVNNDSAWNGYPDQIPDILEMTLKPSLLALTQPFITRDTDSNLIEHRSGKNFNRLGKMLEDLAYYSGSPYVIKPSGEEPGNLSHPSYPFNSDEENWYLFVNTDPELTLEIKGTTFNGVIFTMGKVVLKEGAVVNGAIIAAGRGFDNSDSKGYINGSAAEVDDETGIALRAPRILTDGSNLSVLDSGGYSAVYIEGKNVEINFPDPDPEEGREILLEQFKSQGLDLSMIF